MKISIVSPVYKAEKIVSELVRQVSAAVSTKFPEYEIILVDDRSPDKSWQEIEKAATIDPHVKGIRLSRNFGQHYAITAGLAKVTGDYAVVMDCDLQDDPIDIPRMVELAQNGHDVVLTIKSNRAHSFFKNLSAKLFFILFNLFSDTQTTNSQVGNFSLLSRKVVSSFLSIADVHRHYLMLVRMLGFKVAYLQVEHQERFSGKTSYSFWRLIKHAVDGMVSQSLKLLYASIYLGLIFFVFSMVGIGFFIFNYFTHNVAPGYTSVVVLILLATGLILMSMGILGIYIGKIFDQTRNRPLYIIDEQVNI